MTVTRVLAAVFLALTLAMVGGAVAVALMGDGAVADAGRLVYRLTCHGLEHRSLHVDGSAMPICARCTGIWAGAAIGSLLFLGGGVSRPRVGMLVAVIAVLPLVIDGVSQATGLRESTNALRLATGGPAGFIWIVWALQSVVRNENGVNVTQDVSTVNEV